MLLENERKETPFEVRDNMLELWNQLTELSFRGYGLQKRKPAKEPKNFSVWSEESRKKYIEKQQAKLEMQRHWDQQFVDNESRVIDEMCRRIVHLIDRANSMNPQYLCECDQQRLMHDEAIGLCNNLKRELNHIAETIPCNKNYLAVQTDTIVKEISLLQGWRKSQNPVRDKVLQKEIKRRKTAAEKLGFVLMSEDFKPPVE